MLKLDSLYIYIGGVSHPPPPTATNHRSCLQRRVGAPGGSRAWRAPYERERGTRLASSHQHAGQPHHTGVIHPLVVGSIPAPAGGDVEHGVDDDLPRTRTPSSCLTPASVIYAGIAEALQVLPPPRLRGQEARRR